MTFNWGGADKPASKVPKQWLLWRTGRLVAMSIDACMCVYIYIHTHTHFIILRYTGAHWVHVFSGAKNGTTTNLRYSMVLKFWPTTNRLKIITCSTNLARYRKLRLEWFNLCRSCSISGTWTWDGLEEHKLKVCGDVLSVFLTLLVRWVDGVTWSITRRLSYSVYLHKLWPFWAVRPMKILGH